MTLRSIRFAILLGVLPLGLSPALASAGPSASATAVVAGSVADPLGTVLERVLVLLSPAGGAQQVRTALTDGHGRFRFEGLDAGAYRVTAIKDGYASAASGVSTWFEQRLDLVMLPLSEQGSVRAPASWVLGAPRRDILRELEAAAAMEEANDPAPPEPAAVAGSDGVHPSTVAFLEGLDGEILQSFSEAQAGTSSATPVTGGSGSRTSLQLGSPIGQRVRWDFLGERERETTTWRDADIEGREASAERIRVNFRCDTEAIGRLDMSAYYDHDALMFLPSTGTTSLLETDRDRRAWGYDALWITEVGNDGSLQVDVRYLGSALGSKGGGEDAPSARDAGSDDETFGNAQTQTNVIRTSARLSKKVGSSHRVHLGLKARIYSLGGNDGFLIAPSPGQDADLFSELGREGWTVNVSAAESWNLLEPLALDFGFDVSRGALAMGRQREALVPQVGVTFTPGPSTTLRGTVSYVATDRELLGGHVVRAAEGSSETGQKGYRLRLERRLGQGVLVVLDAQSRPFSYDSIGARWDALDATQAARSLYLSDGSASVREVHLAVEGRASRSTTVTFGGSAGRVDGRLTASLPSDDLVRTMSDGTLRYVSARVSGRFATTGTDVEIDLTHVNERSEAGGRNALYADQRLAMRIIQGLGFLHPGKTDWSLLLAYSSYEPLLEGDEIPRNSDPALRTAQSRVSGGVSVRF